MEKNNTEKRVLYFYILRSQARIYILITIKSLTKNSVLIKCGVVFAHLGSNTGIQTRDAFASTRFRS